MKSNSRRDFIKRASLGVAAVAAPGAVATGTARPTIGSARRRELWIATLTQYQIEGNDLHSCVNAALQQMENALPFSPDIFCLPEVFHWNGIRGTKPEKKDVAENGSGNIIGPFQQFARTHKCYIICPIYTLENGNCYNAAVIIDPQGKKVGEYRKTRLTTGECKTLIPGPREIPVFETPFGKIGVQICFDVEWPEGWRQLAQKGADIVFWPSAFGGGKMLNTYAWQNHYHVVTSTWKGTTKICDITGEEIAASGEYSRWGVCAPVNLEKAFLHSWPYNARFADIEKKYGRKVKISTLHEEEFTVIESLSDDVKVADILSEFELKTHREHLKMAEEVQDKILSRIP